MPTHTITSLPPWGTLFTKLTSANRYPHNGSKSVCHLPSPFETSFHPWITHFSSMQVAIEGEHLPTEVGYNAELQSCQDSGEDDKLADELPWDNVWQFVQKFFCCANPQFHQVAGLRRSCRWRRRIWRFWADMVTCGLQLWGQLDVLPNSLK